MALIAYGLLPVVRNTIVGIESVSLSIVDSARGMGMTSRQILLRTELPIASRIIMAGIRTSMVINIGTATLGAFVGSGGLGTPIASGLSMTVDAFILLGAIPAALLAILTDYVLGGWNRADATWSTNRDLAPQDNCLQMIRQPQRQRDDGQCRIGVAAGREYR